MFFHSQDAEGLVLMGVASQDSQLSAGYSCASHAAPPPLSSQIVPLGPAPRPRPAGAVAITRAAVNESQARAWVATGIASLTGHSQGAGAPPLDAWPAALLAAAPRLRVLSCRGTLSPLCTPLSIPLAPFGALQRLSLVGCQLPDAALDWRALGTMRALAKLSLRGNMLRVLPLSPGDLPALRELNVACNQLGVVGGAGSAGRCRSGMRGVT